MRGFFVFLAFIGRFYLAMARGIMDALLVACRLKFLPPTGRPYWRWRR